MDFLQRKLLIIKKKVLIIADRSRLHNSPKLHFSYHFKTESAEVWHQRLGYPQASAVQLFDTS